MRNTFTPEQEQWLEALESGEWKQATDYLWVQFDGGGRAYCCLGVAAKLNCPGSPSLKPHIAKKHSLSNAAPPKAIRQLMLRGELGQHYEGGSLAELNDSGHTFAEIAATIRAEPWGYFTNFDKP